MSLNQYQKKRDFAQTPEPKGRKKESGLPIFVVQKHSARALHYDFRLEMDGVLKSWAVPKGPSMDPEDKRLAVMVEDHPLEYAKFAGIIPAGQYGAGTVEIWDNGTVQFINDDIKGGHLTFLLGGKKLNGEFALIKLKRAKEKNAWLLIKAAKDIKSEKAKTLAKPPHITTPMLATLVDKPFDDADWLFELKWDGYRAVAEKNGTNVELYSRNNKSFNERYPSIVKNLKSINHNYVIDGEIVVLDSSGHSSFQELQSYLKDPVKLASRLFYYVFDLLFLDGKDLRPAFLSERKMLLETIIPKNSHIRYSDHVEGKGKDFFQAAKKNNVEGIIAKNSQSIYVEGRSREWQKIKNINQQEIVICGFTAPRFSRHYFGALIMGVYKKGKLVYVGHTGSGFDEQMLEKLYKKMKPLINKKSPFDITPKTNEPATWIKPELVGQVKFAEWTSDGIMRQPIFLGLREDKLPKEVHREGINA